MAEILSPIMPQDMQDNVIDALHHTTVSSEIASYILEYTVPENHSDAIKQGQEWFNDTTSTMLNQGNCNHMVSLYAEELHGVTQNANSEVHVDIGKTITCSVSTRPDLQNGTVNLPEFPIYVAGVMIDSLFKQVPHQKLQRKNKLHPKLIAATHNYVQPANGQLVIFDAAKEAHAAPILPPNTLRILFTNKVITSNKFLLRNSFTGMPSNTILLPKFLAK